MNINAGYTKKDLRDTQIIAQEDTCQQVIKCPWCSQRANVITKSMLSTISSNNPQSKLIPNKSQELPSLVMQEGGKRRCNDHASQLQRQTTSTTMAPAANHGHLAGCRGAFKEASGKEATLSS